jgi:hypothetical protein
MGFSLVELKDAQQRLVIASVRPVRAAEACDRFARDHCVYCDRFPGLGRRDLPAIRSAVRPV